MAAMQQLRDKTHVFIWIILVLFILSMTIGGLVGGANIMDIISGKSKLYGIAGMVNGEKLEAEKYVQFIQYQLEQYKQSGYEVNDRIYEMVADQTWDQFVDEILLKEQVGKMKLDASEEEIYEYVMNFPSAYLRQNESFLTNGQFDILKYQEILSQADAAQLIPLEQQAAGTLPFQKIQNLIQNASVVSLAEAKEELAKTKTKYTFESLTVPFALVRNDSFTVSDEEIQAYYTEHKEDYFQAETRSLDYVHFEMKPSAQDTQNVVETLNDLKYRINNGESFETIANEYTEDPSGKTNGGDLGWFGRGQMVGPFEDAAFTSAKGALVGPVATSFGYHLIKVEDKRNKDGKPEVKARHILLKVQIGPETMDDLRTQANYFSFDASEYGFDTAADSHKVEIQNITDITKSNSFIGQLGRMPRAIRFAFSDKPIGAVSEMMGSDKGYVILRLADAAESFYKPVEDVKPMITRTLENEKKLEKLEMLANEVYAKIDAARSLKDYAGEMDNLLFAKHDDVLLSSSMKNIGRSNEITGTLMALEPGQVSKPVAGASKFAILKMVSKTELEGDEKDIETAVAYDKLNRQRPSNFYQGWVKSLRDDADITDNRDNLYN